MCAYTAGGPGEQVRSSADICAALSSAASSSPPWSMPRKPSSLGDQFCSKWRTGAPLPPLRPGTRRKTGCAPRQRVVKMVAVHGAKLRRATRELSAPPPPTYGWRKPPRRRSVSYMGISGMRSISTARRKGREGKRAGRRQGGRELGETRENGNNPPPPQRTVRGINLPSKNPPP